MLKNTSEKKSCPCSSTYDDTEKNQKSSKQLMWNKVLPWNYRKFSPTLPLGKSLWWPDTTISASTFLCDGVIPFYVKNVCHRLTRKNIFRSAFSTCGVRNADGLSTQLFIRDTPVCNCNLKLVVELTKEIMPDKARWSKPPKATIFGTKMAGRSALKYFCLRQGLCISTKKSQLRRWIQESK